MWANDDMHGMFPEATQDEQALQNYLKSLRIQVTGQFHGGNRKLFENKLAPQFEAEHGRAPETRKEIRELLLTEPHNQWWGSMLRTTQEMLYQNVGPSIERQLPELVDKFREREGKLGSLTLDPDLPLPKYHSAVDIHCKPGGYHTELTEDCVFAGAEFDRTLRLYSMGGLGPDLDDCGNTTSDWVKRNFPDLMPERILDMGCTLGHSTLPFQRMWPEAELHGIDVAAPLLRYAHARAVDMGYAVHYSQQNAEHTNFEDESFDLVVSQIMMHETSYKALRNVFKESFRLLKPGGVMAHVEVIERKTPFDKYYSEWMAHFNNEPFIGAVQEQDFVEISKEAGFSGQIIEDFMPSLHNQKANEGKTAAAYFVIAAVK